MNINENNFNDIFSQVELPRLPIPPHPSVEERKMRMRVSEINGKLMQCKSLLKTISTKTHGRTTEH